MSKEYTVTTRCDSCGVLDNETDIEYQEVTVKIGRSAPRQLDLCAVCAGKLVLVVERGVVVGRKPTQRSAPKRVRKEPEHSAGYCDICDKEFLNAAGLRTHKGRAHKEEA